MLRSTSPVDQKFRTDYEFRGNCSSSPEAFPVLVLRRFCVFCSLKYSSSFLVLRENRFTLHRAPSCTWWFAFLAARWPVGAAARYNLVVSSDFVPFPPPQPTEALYLVGFRLDPEIEGPQFYTLFVLESENDRPLIANGRVLFFAALSSAAEALALADNDMSRLGPAPSELEMFCDIAEALHIANAQDADSDGVLLETIALFDDLVRAIHINVPAQYMSVLSALSERLATTPEFATMLAETGLDRETIEDALMWCVGAVAVKGRWI